MREAKQLLNEAQNMLVEGRNKRAWEKLLELNQLFLDDMKQKHSDIIEGHIQAWEKKNATVIENIIYSDIRLLADALRVPESRIVSVIERFITNRNQATTIAFYKGANNADK